MSRREGRWVPLRNLRELRLAEASDGRHAQAYDIGGLLRCTVAVAQFMSFVEAPLDFGARCFISYVRRHLHRDGVFLADVAHVRGSLENNLISRDTRIFERLAAFSLKLFKFIFKLEHFE